MLTGLSNLGILKGSTEKLFDNKIYEYFMPHSIGHYIGFKTHDVGFKRKFVDKDTIPSKDNQTIKPKMTIDEINMYEPVTWDILVENVVTTIEPGIYFIDILK